MARQLFTIGRSSRTGTSTLSPFTLPTEDGVIVTSLDIIPSQRTETSRVVEFVIEVLNGQTWEPLTAGRWQGSPETATPTEEFPMRSGSRDLRGAQVRWRFTIPSGSVNVGGSVEHFTYAEIDARLGNN